MSRLLAACVRVGDRPRPGSGWVLAAAVAAFLMFPATGLAATFTVNTTADNAPSASECSGAAGDCSLRQAIDKSNKSSTDDTIDVPAGDYKLTIPGANETADATGDLDVNKATGTMTIVGTAGARSTTIDATGLGDRILQVVTGTATITGFTLTGGAAPLDTVDSLYSQGGAIENSGGTLTLTDSTVTGNATTNGSYGDGGGVAQPNGTAMTLMGDTFTNNTSAQYGGGVDVDSGTATIIDTTIVNNTAADDGGGMDTDTGSTVQLTNDTIDANTTPNGGGGGVWVVGSNVQFVNTIVANNSAPSTPSTADCYQNAPLTDQGHNLDNSGSCFTAGSNGDINADPKLGPLQNNGGPSDTQALLDGSPAINAGSNASCPATDQRGIARPQPPAGTCDIGAYEATPPLVQTQAAASITTSSATLNGTVNPDNLATSYHFEYGTTTGYGHSTPTQSVGSDYSTHQESLQVSGLAPGATYHFRIVATNSVGTSDGADMTFTTPPSVSTGAASGITATRAKVSGTVDTNGAATAYYFQYGTSTAYGHSTSSASAGSSPATFSSKLSGLKPRTTYHYRIVASDAGGTSYGADRTFKTAKAAFKGAVAAAQTDTISVAGLAHVRVVCPRGTYKRCVGTIRLLENGKVIGSASFSIGSGRSAKVTVRLSAAGQAAVRAAGRVKVTAVDRSHDALGTRRSRSRAITLVAPSAPAPKFTG